MKLLLIILLLLATVTQQRRDDPKHWKHPFKSDEGQLTDDQPVGKEMWFNEQIVDHFNYKNGDTWKQRYFLVNQTFNPSVGPVFIYICGEYTCPGVPGSRKWVLKMAEQFQAMVLVLEHRFYGKSMPFGNDSMKMENLAYLNSEQALSDIAYFIQRMQTTQQHKITAKTPFISIGGSYPGALSAWFRYKYPHMTIGSIASSAVVEAIEDFKDFDEQMYMSSSLSGQACMKAINDSNSLVEQKLNSAQGQSFKASFTDGENLSNDQFLFFWIDSIVGQIQYGQRTKLCDELMKRPPSDQFQYLKGLAHDNQVYEYSSKFLKDDTVGPHTDSRSWYYQSCSEYGFWQTPSDRHPLRSSRLNINFYRDFCNNAFGNSLWPKVQRKNIEYGGTNLKAFRLLMVNGVQGIFVHIVDPWRWASLQKSQQNIISRVANCTNCAHCVDLYTPTDSDPVELKNIRNQQYLTLQQWIQQHWRTVRSINFNNELQRKSLLRQQ